MTVYFTVEATVPEGTDNPVSGGWVDWTNLFSDGYNISRLVLNKKGTNIVGPFFGLLV